MRKAAVLAAALLVETAHGQSYSYTANDLVAEMRAWEDALDATYDNDVIHKAGRYIGFVMGVYSATARDYCLGERVVDTQIVAVVSDYLKENPQLWDQEASFVVSLALLKGFSCVAPITSPDNP